MGSMNIKHSIRIVSFLWLGSILGAGCAFLTQALLARELGPASFGVLSSSLSLVVMLTPLASFGVGAFWLKVFGQEGWLAVRWLSSTIKYTLLTSFIVVSVLLLWAIYGPHDLVTRCFLMLLTIHLLGQVILELVSAKLQLEESFHLLAFWQFFPHFIRLILISILALIMNEWLTLFNVGYIYVLVSMLIFIIGGAVIWKLYIGRLSLKGHGEMKVEQLDTTTLVQVFINSWPFGLGGLIYLVYFQSNIVLLKYLVTDEAAGIYSVSFMIMIAIYMLPNVIYLKFLQPKLHRWASHDREKFYLVYKKGNILMLLLGLVSTLIILCLGNILIQKIFGIGYQDSVAILMVLALAAPARFMISSVGAILTTKHHLKDKLYIVTIVGVFNVLLNVIFIHLYGYIGAAVATVISEILLAFVMQVYARRYVFTDLEKRAFI